MMPEQKPHIQLDPNRRNQYNENLEGKAPPYCDADLLQFSRQPYKMKGLSSPFQPRQSWADAHATREEHFPEDAFVPIT
jgi:hypothetical protein